jgi:hypothetical protein
MKIKILIFLLGSALILSAGCGKEKLIYTDSSDYIYVGFEPETSQMYNAVIIPPINTIDKNSRELMQQNKWLIKQLDKCLTLVEKNKNLKPLPLEPHRPLTAYPNRTIEQNPETTEAITEVEDLKMLLCLLNMRNMFLIHQIDNCNNRIHNFKLRIDRLEECTNK